MARRKRTRPSPAPSPSAMRAPRRATERRRHRGARAHRPGERAHHAEPLGSAPLDLGLRAGERAHVQLRHLRRRLSGLRSGRLDHRPGQHLRHPRPHSETFLDFGAIQRLRGAKSTARALGPPRPTRPRSPGTAANAYLRAQRADAQLSARSQTPCSRIRSRHREREARAGVGVALDVTRAKSQLATVRAQLIGSRNERDRSRTRSPARTRRATDGTRHARRQPQRPLGARHHRGRGCRDRHRHALASRSSGRGRTAARGEQQVTAIRAERLPSLSAFGDYGWVTQIPQRVTGVRRAAEGVTSISVLKGDAGEELLETAIPSVTFVKHGRYLPDDSSREHALRGRHPGAS